MITKEQEVLLKDLRKSHASLAEAEKVINSMEGLSASEKQLALKLHIPYADAEQVAGKTIPLPPPVAEPNEVLTLGSEGVSHRKPKPKKFSFPWVGFWVVAVGLVLLFFLFGNHKTERVASEKHGESKTFSETVFGHPSLKGSWNFTTLNMQGQSVQLKFDFRADGTIVENGINLGNKWKEDTIILDNAGNSKSMEPILAMCCRGAKDEDIALRDSAGKIIGTGLTTLQKVTPDKRGMFPNVLIEVKVHRVDDDHFDLGPISFVREGK